MTLSAKEKFKNVKCVLFDLDGTVYLGKEVFPFTKDVLAHLESAGIQYCFLTNNSSLSSEDYLKKFEKMKIPCSKEQIYTSGDAAVSYLRKNYDGKRIELLGTSSLKKQFAGSGIILDDNSPDLAVVAFDTDLNYKNLTSLCNSIVDGVPYIATHPDNFCPAEKGILPDVGAFLALIERATGVAPSVICGKPYEIMAEGICGRFSLNPSEFLMVGDRLATDIAFGTNNGMRTMLVLTGEGTLNASAVSDIRPDVIARDISVLKEIF